MKRNEAAQATQKSRVKPRPVIEKAPKLLQLPLILVDHNATANVRFGSWLCENAKTVNHDRRTCSSKTVLVAQRASGFNLEIELKNIILRRVSIFEFSHSQGQTEKSGRSTGWSALPPTPDMALHRAD
jgi:hypothetical protein